MMLKNNEPYRYAKIDVIKKKLVKCRGKTQPAPKTAAPVEASPPPAGSALIDLYRLHGLPACQSPNEWSPGEQRALERAEVTTFAQSAHKPPKIATKGPRRTSASAVVK